MRSRSTLALGATHAGNAASDEALEQIRALSCGGVEYALEFAGSTRAVELAYRATCRGGSTVTAGLPPPSATFALPMVHLVAEERTVRGSYIGTCVPSRDIPRYMALYRRGCLPVDKLLSGRLKLEDINTGFDRLREGSAIRQVVVFDWPLFASPAVGPNGAATSVGRLDVLRAAFRGQLLVERRTRDAEQARRGRLVAIGRRECHSNRQRLRLRQSPMQGLDARRGRVGRFDGRRLDRALRSARLRVAMHRSGQQTPEVSGFQDQLVRQQRRLL